jgi:hypothetical protein
MDTDDRYTRITLRLPKALHAQLSAAADETSKSTNAEIVARLQESFSGEPRRQPLTEQAAAIHTLTALYQETVERIADWKRVTQLSETEKIELIHEEATARYLRHAIARAAVPPEERARAAKQSQPLGIDRDVHLAVIVAEHSKPTK